MDIAEREQCAVLRCFTRVVLDTGPLNGCVCVCVCVCVLRLFGLAQ